MLSRNCTDTCPVSTNWTEMRTVSIKAFGSTFNVLNHDIGLMNHIRCYERMKNHISMHKSSLTNVAPQHAQFPINASGSAFKVRNRVFGVINRFGC